MTAARHAAIASAWLASMWIAGCGSRAAAPTAPTQAHVQAAATSRAISSQDVHVEPMQEGVTAGVPSCTEGATDLCNGLDDDCDARIDEGCGWESGAIQITLAWENAADLDLYVVDPLGYTISYMDRDAPGGGRLDHDARGACVPGNDTVENVFWSGASPTRGQYMVDVHYWGECGVTGTTPAHLSVSVGGQILGVYAFTLQPGQRQSIVVFTL